MSNESLDHHYSTAPGLRGSLLGRRPVVTVWLPCALVIATLVWALLPVTMPAWWYGPALLTAFSLSGDPIVRLTLHMTKDLEAQRRVNRSAITATGSERDVAVAASSTVMASPDGSPRTEESSATGTPGGNSSAGLPLRGGLMIGILERACVMACLTLGFPNGVAIVVAIKGLARYGEFTNAQQREQFIIGTLGSLLWAGAGAGVVVLLNS